MKIFIQTVLILLIIISDSTMIKAQVSTNFNFGTIGDFVGWDGSMTIPLDIRQNNTTSPQNIDFYTDSTFQMTILGNTVYNNGFVGVGLSLPRLKFEVNNNIGVIPQTWEEGYFIDSFAVLRVWPDPLLGLENLFVGIGAGYNAANTGSENTYVGTNAGLANTSGSSNTFTGRGAGVVHATGDENSFYGAGSGRNSTSGTFNTFIGNLSGQGTIDGFENTVVGYRAYSSSPAGTNNSIFGANAALLLDSAELNVIVGAASANNLETGNRNVILGARTLPNALEGHELVLLGNQSDADDGLTNATAIGANAWVRNNNQMILGDTGIFVGIGLSGDATGPQNFLEINTSGANLSGLRFRDLTSSSPASVSNITRVLTLNGSGDVIFGDIPIGTGPITACTSPGLTTNYITKASASTQICRSQVYDDGTTVGIGVGASVDNAFVTQIRGDVLIEHPTGGSTTGDIYMTDNIASNKLRVFAMHGNGGREALSIGPGAGGVGITNTALTGVYIGRNAGNIVNDDIMNTFVGNSSGLVYNGTAGEGENTFVGFLSGSDITTGEQNTFIGTEAAPNIVTGSDNVYIGQQSGNDGVTTANENVVIGRGYFNGTGLTTSSNSILIGNAAHALFNGSTFTNSVSIGHANRVACENCFTIASQDNSVTEQQVGIGFNNPSTTIGTGSTGGQEAKLYVDDYNGSGVAAYFNGSVYTNAGVVTASDAMFKDNVQPITNATMILNQLEPKTYNYKTSAFPGMSFLTGTHYGFIAQEVEAVLPGLVTTMVAPAVLDDNGNIEIDKFDFKAVNYEEFIPIMFGAMKEMQTRIDNLELSLNQCCNPQPRNENPGSSTINRSSISLSNNEIIILNQNSPNPFKDKTEITYILPEIVKDAVILFYDHSGKVLQKFDISHRGAGSLTVYGEDLTSGVYTYSLIIDGENHQTKRMVKQ